MVFRSPEPSRVRHTQHSGRRPKVSPWIQASTKMSGGAVDAWQVSAVASLVEELDKKILVVLREGSKIIVFLRSFDQFANIVLENACERIIVGTSFSDIPLGLYIVRGENVVLMGDIDETIETEGLTEVSNEEIKREREAEKAADKFKGEMLKRMDFLED